MGSQSQVSRGELSYAAVRMGERDESGEESEWETDEDGEGDDENDESEKEVVVEEGCPVKPGDLLVSARPFVYAIQGQFKSKVCDWCFVYKDEWQGITMCPACNTVGYCGKRCRDAARPRHQVECGLLVLRGRKTWPHRAWFLARACLRLDAEGWDERDKINNTKSRAFRDLLDHYSDITSDDSRTKDINGYWEKEVAELLGDLMPPMEEYLSIYGRLLVNSFALRVDNKGEEESVGTALYRANWIFDCLCPACTDPKAELGKHAALCEKGSCAGQVCVEPSTWQWTNCLACGETPSRELKFKYQETYEVVRQVVDENGGEMQYTDVAEFLVKQMLGKFHSTDL